MYEMRDNLITEEEVFIKVLTNKDLTKNQRG